MSVTLAVMMRARVVSVVNRRHVADASESRRREMSTDIPRPGLRGGDDPPSSGLFDGVRVAP